jgi:hypothetical protein
MKATFYGGSVTMIILIMASISGPALFFTQTAIASIEGKAAAQQQMILKQQQQQVLLLQR